MVLVSGGHGSQLLGDIQYLASDGRAAESDGNYAYDVQMMDDSHSGDPFS